MKWRFRVRVFADTIEEHYFPNKNAMYAFINPRITIDVMIAYQYTAKGWKEIG